MTTHKPLTKAERDETRDIYLQAGFPPGHSLMALFDDLDAKDTEIVALKEHQQSPGTMARIEKAERERDEARTELVAAATQLQEAEERVSELESVCRVARCQWNESYKSMNTELAETKAEVAKLKVMQVELCRRNLRLQPEHVAKLEAVVAIARDYEHTDPHSCCGLETALRALDGESE